jgi:uncharacterized protein YbjT (DUF2867 family)
MGIAWTFVQPGAFMSNALHWRNSIKGQGKVFSNYGDGKLAYIHPRDIAAEIHDPRKFGHGNRREIPMVFVI